MEQMSEQIEHKAVYSAGVLSVLPIIYMGWADSMLSPGEMRAIHDLLQQLPHLSAAEKAQIIRWSNPAEPPDEEIFKEWINQMKIHATSLPRAERSNLATLGLAMAQKAYQHPQRLWEKPEIKLALEQLEQALGLAHTNGHQRLYRRLAPTTESAAAPTSSTWPVIEMTRLLDDEYHALRQRVRALLEDPAFRYRHFEDKEAYRAQVMAWLKVLAVQGFGALSYPPQYGGKNAGGQYAAIFETLAHHDLSLVIKFGVQFGLFGGAILHLGTEKHHRQYLADIGKLNLAGCFAMTETNHGSNVRGLETTAVYDPQHQQFVIHTPHVLAGKEYIGNALYGRMAVVFGQLITLGVNHGVHAFIVPLRDAEHHLLPGIHIEDNGYKMGLNGVDNGKIWFHHVCIPRENLLDKFGQVSPDGSYHSPIDHESKRFFTMLSTLVGGRICVARAGLSAAKSGLAIAVRYALRRRQFGSKADEPETLLLDYPTHQHRLLPALAKVYALDMALTALAKDYDQAMLSGDLRGIETRAAGLKAYTTWFTTATLQSCREACGGKGYLRENRLADLKADADIFTTFEGDNTVLMQLVAKALLTNMKEQLHDEGYWGLMKILAGSVATSITEQNAYMVRKTDAQHLLSSDFHLNAFRFRERHMLMSLSNRMRKYLRRRVDPHEAFLRCQLHMVDTAQAFVEREILEACYAQINVLPRTSPLYASLTRLAQLFALSVIQERHGWYLENDYLQGVKSKAIRKLVANLCREVRQEALPLVGAFAISSDVLGAPIAR